MSGINSEIIQNNFNGGANPDDDNVTIVEAVPTGNARRRRLVLIIGGLLMLAGIGGIVLQLFHGAAPNANVEAVTTPPLPSALAQGPAGPGQQGSPTPDATAAAQPGLAPTVGVPSGNDPAQASLSTTVITQSPSGATPTLTPAAQSAQSAASAAAAPPAVSESKPPQTDPQEIAKMKEALAKAEERAKAAESKAAELEGKLKAEKQSAKAEKPAPAATKDQKLPTQAVSMKEAGILAVLTDGLLILKNGEEREVSIGDFAPMLRGKIVRTSPADKFVWTTEKLYKLN